jgi:hypothetical protein
MSNIKSPFGNYCGPYWSAGKFQESVVSEVEATGELDGLCRVHDAAYATGADRTEADWAFAESAIQLGGFGLLFGALVGAQGAIRSTDKYFNTRQSTMKPKTAVKQTAKQPPRLRGSNPSQASGTVMTTPPTAFGSTIRAVKPKMTRTVESARIEGRDFIGTVEGQGVATFGLGKSALLSPAYFASSFLGNLARSYEKYRWNKLRIHYVPKVATTAPGQVILCSQRSVSEPGLQPESGTFLQRAMSQGNAVFSPLWIPTYIDIDCSGEYKLLDSTTTVDIDDCIHEELQVYTQVAVSGQVGYLFAEYDVSFREPIYQPHSTSFPISTGPGLRATFGNQSAVAAGGDALRLTETTTLLNFASVPNGTIYRCVLDVQPSTAPTPLTLANAFNVASYGHLTAGSIASTTSTFSLIGGTTLYLAVFAGYSFAYTSLEAAVNGDGSGQLLFAANSTSPGTFVFDVAMVRVGVALLPVIQ